MNSGCAHLLPDLQSIPLTRSHDRIGSVTMKTTQTIDYSEAKQIIDRIVEKALHMKKAAVIAVADSHGELIAFARMDGAPISSIRIAANKAWTAARERKSTQDIGERVRHPEKGHDIAYYGDPKFVGWGGGIPVWKRRPGGRRSGRQRPFLERGRRPGDAGCRTGRRQRKLTEEGTLGSFARLRDLRQKS